MWLAWSGDGDVAIVVLKRGERRRGVGSGDGAIVSFVVASTRCMVRLSVSRWMFGTGALVKAVYVDRFGGSDDTCLHH